MLSVSPNCATSLPCKCFIILLFFMWPALPVHAFDDHDAHLHQIKVNHFALALHTKSSCLVSVISNKVAFQLIQEYLDLFLCTCNIFYILMLKAYNLLTFHILMFWYLVFGLSRYGDFVGLEWNLGINQSELAHSWISNNETLLWKLHFLELVFIMDSRIVINLSFFISLIQIQMVICYVFYYVFIKQPSKFDMFDRF